MRGRDRFPHSAFRNRNGIPGGRIEVQVIKLMESLSKWAWMGERSYGQGVKGLVGYRKAVRSDTQRSQWTHPLKHSSHEKGDRRG